MPNNPKLYIVFDGPPGPDSPKFVEVETEQGTSVSVGEWRKEMRGSFTTGLWTFGPFYEYPGEEDA